MAKKRRRKSWKKQLAESTKKNIERAHRLKAKARTTKPKVGDWRTRTDGRLTREGEKLKFRVKDRRKGDVAVRKTLQRPMTVWESVAKQEEERRDAYDKRIEEHKAKMKKLREIKLLAGRCKDKDDVRRAMAKAEFLRKYPDEYAQYDWDKETGKIVTPEKEHRTIPIILRRPKSEPKEEPKPKEEKKEPEVEEKKKKTFSEEEIEKAVEESEHEERVEAKKKKEHEIELQQQYG